MDTLQNITLTPSVSSRDIFIHQPKMILFFAHVFSVLFHPLFIPLYVTGYLTFIHPGYFNGIPEREKLWVLIRVAVNMVFLPAVSVFLLKGVGFIDSILLKTKKDRIIPYVISNFFFFWMYLVFRHQGEVPSILTSFVFSVFLSSSVALLANIYFKISMHAIGTGGLIGLFFVILHTNASSPVTLPLALAFLITGIVCTSRMIVSNHTPKEIYAGLVLGIVCQLIGAAFIL